MERLEKETIIEKAKIIAKIVGNGNNGRVEIIGNWIWVTFAGKPSQEIRDCLKAQGAKWNERRHCWQIMNGYQSKPSKFSKPVIESRYGSMSIENEN
ncbi:MAG: hypothetical protein A2Z35_02880 [Actinobacteria bacterium RBG_19FT_COMBO_36_27]|nr:MAG: hypothetical protein A2Z35_02880 [Actinobacteria bacterium RBG_19FT_COMBO_36_27]